MAQTHLPFTKMHGLENDYVVVDAAAHAVAEPEALARAICDRRTGVGADGLLLVGPSGIAAFRMRMFNVDGSEAEMCGNGLRCAARFAADRGLIERGGATEVETGAGILAVAIAEDGRVSVDMGAPELPDGSGTVERLDVDGEQVELTLVRLGNPHAVLFVDSVEAAPVARLGPAIERHARFPDRTNVEFVEVLAPDRVRQRTWERGCGETRACGTGACATVVASATTGRTGRHVVVGLLGGDLDVEWTADGTVRQTGPAVTVFDGSWPLVGA